MNNKGITLAEVMVSILMVTMGSLGIAKATAGMTRMHTNGSRAAVGAIESQSRMEQIRATGCATLASGSDATANGYNLTWTVSGSGNTRSVLLVTSYTSGGGITRTDSMATTVGC